MNRNSNTSKEMKQGIFNKKDIYLCNDGLYKNGKMLLPLNPAQIAHLQIHPEELMQLYKDSSPKAISDTPLQNTDQTKDKENDA